MPVEPVLKLVALGLALAIAVANAGGMMSSWTTFALFKVRAAGFDRSIRSSAADLGFYLFTLPAWQLVAGWLLTLAVIACGLIAGLFVSSPVAGGSWSALAGHRPADWRGLSVSLPSPCC